MSSFSLCTALTHQRSSSPTLVFLIFGRKSILSSVPAWQSLLYPPVFSAVITHSLRWLFGWHSENIPALQKLAAFAHLYSTASVKSVVHWFQIMRNAKFQMFDDDVQRVMVIRRAAKPSGVTAYAPARFPTRNIVAPIVLMYGDRDSLVDIDVMLSELPRRNVAVRRLHGYEHLDVIWGGNVHEDVIPHVVESLRKYCERPERLEREVKMVNGLSITIDPSGYTTPADVDAM